jgi:hypothetical protein
MPLIVTFLDMAKAVALSGGPCCCGSTPFWIALVVDQVVGAEVLQTRQLFVGRRGGDHRCAGGPGELDCKDGHPAGALRQHDVSQHAFFIWVMNRLLN